MWRGVGADPAQPAAPLVSACPKGQVLDPDTGECAIVFAQPGDVITPCPPGQHTDPVTYLCKPDATAADVVPRAIRASMFGPLGWASVGAGLLLAGAFLLAPKRKRGRR